MRKIALFCLLAFGCASVTPTMEAKTKKHRRGKKVKSRRSSSSAAAPPSAGRTPYNSTNPMPPSSPAPAAPGTVAPPNK